jgi:hypothetical protein
MEMIKPFDRVRLVNDRFEAEGVPRDSLGYVIEAYPDGALEVEFSDPATGQTWATIVAQVSDLVRTPEPRGDPAGNAG